MAFSKSLLVSVAALPLLSAAADLPLVGKRSNLLETRATCEPGYVPACPVGIPCVPPGAICCSDGIHYAMPPETCPEGTDAVATAIGSSEPAPEPTSSSAPPASSGSAQPTGVPPTSSSSVVPTGTGQLPGPTGTGSPDNPPYFEGAASAVKGSLGLAVGAAVLAMM
ncbi:hypothetical protein VTN31DRAFT_5726 [Thermomyces dupontii]|uniref:uncharacterized protein n=1 Tax=Talaromyces thermophilus TaxID=28565 RepID=UPI003743F5D0